MVWSHKHEVNIITSASGWYLEYALNLVKSIKQLNFTTHLLHDYLRASKNSICFYLSYPNIVSKDAIEKSYKSLVVHASYLPAGKGFSPWVWQIIEGKNIIPLCLFEMVEKLDAGPIIDLDYMKLSGDELLPEIREQLAQRIEKMCLKYLGGDDAPKGTVQNGEESFYRRRNQEDSRLVVDKTILEQFNLLRVVDNERYPAYFDHLGERYILKIEKFKEKGK